MDDKLLKFECLKLAVGAVLGGGGDIMKMALAFYQFIEIHQFEDKKEF